MQLARTTIRLCAVLLSLTYMGCSSDNEDGGTSTTGGATTTVTGTKATGGRTGTGGTASTTTATGGASSTVTTTGGATAVTTGGASAVATGGATGVVTTGGATAAGGGPTTGGSTGVTSFSISGTVTGLSGTGLVLAIGTDALAIGANGPFTFPKQYASGSAITVAIATQPSGPPQLCTVSAAGTIASLTSNVTDVAITCSTSSYTIGGTVTGLIGTGLVLQNNAGDDLTIGASGAFAFATKVASGLAYTVSVKTQPSNPTQNCTVSGGSGIVGSANVSAVTINCDTNSYTIGGTVSGLDGTGLVLQNNAGDDVAISTNGSFAFATPVLSGKPFAVTVKAQPTEKSQTCEVKSGTGTVASGNVTTVDVACTTNKYKVKGTVTGLLGTGLTLQNNLGDNLPVAVDGEFAFPTSIASGGLYSVTVLQQPNQPAQECIVTAGSGPITNADITNVAINCTTSTFTVGGTVVGLIGTGLVLQNNATDDLTIDADGTFTFGTKIASGSPFVVTVKSTPNGEFCSVAGGRGTVGSGPVNVTVNCSDQAHTVSGTVTGLAGKGLQLALNGGNIQSVFGDQFAFTDLIAKGGAYEVTVAKQPTNPWQTCQVANGSAIMGSEEVTNVEVTCVTNKYPVGGTITGLKGAGLVLQNNLGDDVTITADAGQPVTFTFPTNVESGKAYSATIKTHPSSPMQECLIANGGGSVSGVAITNIQITCTTKSYTVGGTISGLASSVVLANNITDTLTLAANGAFTFDGTVESGANFSVEVKTQPTDPWQTCTVTGGAGPVVDTNISSVVVECVTNKYTIYALVTGLASGESLVLVSGDDVLTVTADGTLPFATQVTSGQPYAVTMTTAPQTQNCSLSGTSGTVGGSNVTVTVNCTNKPTVSGTVNGLLGSGLVLTLNDTVDVAVSGTSFAFPTFFEDGDPYQVTVKSNPTQPWQTCSVTNGSGEIQGASATDVIVDCVTTMLTLSVDVSGLAGTTGAVLQNNNGSSLTNLTVTGNGVTAFAAKVASGSNYDVSVLTQPSSPSQTCDVASNTGVVGGTDIVLAVTCVTNKYKVGGTVTGGPVSGLVLKNNGGDDLSIAATGTFSFATPIDSGAAYAVTVATQPTAGLTCTVTSGVGNVGGGDVTSIVVKCPPVPYTFDTDSSRYAWNTWNTPETGTVRTWLSTEGSPDLGSLQYDLALSPTNCNSSMNIQTQPTGLNLNGFTTMTAMVRVDDQFPVSNGGGVALFVQTASSFVNPSFYGWSQFTLGVWREMTMTLPSTVDLNAVTSIGLNFWNGNDPAVCQATRILIDSVRFQ